MVASASQSFGGRINGNQMFVHESIESTNCHAKDDLDCDTHIEMVLDPIKGDASARMIVEVTPRWRFPMSERGMDWATRTRRDRFQGHWVKVREVDVV